MSVNGLDNTYSVLSQYQARMGVSGSTTAGTNTRTQGGGATDTTAATATAGADVGYVNDIGQSNRTAAAAATYAPPRPGAMEAMAQTTPGTGAQAATNAPPTAMATPPTATQSPNAVTPTQAANESTSTSDVLREATNQISARNAYSGSFAAAGVAEEMNRSLVNIVG